MGVTYRDPKGTGVESKDHHLRGTGGRKLSPGGADVEYPRHNKGVTVMWTDVTEKCYLMPQVCAAQLCPGDLLPYFLLLPSRPPPQGTAAALGPLLWLGPWEGQAVSSGLGEAQPAGQPGLLRLLDDAERVWGSAGRPGGGERAGGPFSRDRSARRLSLNLRSDRSIRYFPLLPENSILGLELGPRLNLSGNQRGGDRDRDVGRDREGEIQKGRD